MMASAQPLADADVGEGMNGSMGFAAREALRYHDVGVVHPPETRITPNMTIGEAATWVLQHVPGSFQVRFTRLFV